MSFWHGRKVLITGAGGFIPSHLTELLVARGANVRAMVHYNSRNTWGHLDHLSQALLKELEVVSGDIRDPYFCRKAVEGTSVVMHLAALIAIPYSYLAPAEQVSTNVMGTLNVMQACRELGVEKVCHTSTSETYGTGIYVPIDEVHPLQGQSPYSASKIGADKVAESYYCSFATPVAIVRPFNTYGPRQSARAVIPTIISQIAAGKQEIRLGSLSPSRDLTYVQDTVEGFAAIAECPDTVGQVVNLGTGVGVTIGELAELIMRLMGRRVEILEDHDRIRPEKSEVMRLLCCANKARALTGWTAKVPLEEGLLNTIAYVQAHLDNYKTSIYNV